MYQQTLNMADRPDTSDSEMNAKEEKKLLIRGPRKETGHTQRLVSVVNSCYQGKVDGLKKF